MNEKLKRGQIILIKNERFKVAGMIEFQEDTWIWQEYKIQSESNSRIKWLSVEENEGKIQYSIYEENYSIGNVKSLNFQYQNEEYSLFEQGTARVKQYFGGVDVDLNEKVQFREYINVNKDKLISIEDWDGEIEKSIGHYLNETDVVITQEVVQMPKQASSTGCAIFTFIFMGLFMIVPIIGSLFTSRSAMSNFINKSSKFDYVTSVTNNENNKKAKVYKTDLTVEEAVKAIIDGVPEKVKKVTETSKDDDGGIGIFTSSEYAYVYESEDNETYVQVSKKNYVTSNCNAYRSRYRTRGYYRTYSTSSTNSEYTSYLKSARQQSINARKSSGGGTSSGK